MVTLTEIMTYKSFEKAKLVTGVAALHKEVNGIMVMEAPDIETWGRKGLMILTSYFAMKDVSHDQISHFFQEAEKIGISAIVVKLDRLVHEIPEIFVTSCQKHNIALFQIDKTTPYEKIITEVLEKIINRNAYVLRSFYDIHNQFTQLMMHQPDIIEILETLKVLLEKPISLLELPRNQTIGTDTQYDTFTVLSSETYLQDKHFNFDYILNKVVYRNEPDSVYNQLVFHIPNLGYEEYHLIIHERGSTSSDVDFMAIENAVRALQTDLLTRYAIRQSKQSRLNEMVSDLVHGRLTQQEDIADTIIQLGLDYNQKYQVILVSFHAKSAEHKENDKEISRFYDSIINQSRVTFPGRIYITRKNTIIIIAPAQQESVDAVKKRIQDTFKPIEINELFNYYKVHATISDAVDLAELTTGYSQAVDAQRVLQFTNPNKAIFSYQDMGILQIFVETDNIGSLERFIPSSFFTLRKENPELLKTFKTFIDLNQNYTETAQKLFVHPKTVRYRIDRLKEVYQMDLNNPEEILRYSIGFRLLQFIEEGDNGTRL